MTHYNSNGISKNIKNTKINPRIYMVIIIIVTTIITVIKAKTLMETPNENSYGKNNIKIAIKVTQLEIIMMTLIIVVSIIITKRIILMIIETRVVIRTKQ